MALLTAHRANLHIGTGPPKLHAHKSHKYVMGAMDVSGGWFASYVVMPAKAGTHDG